jgi:hypothetical protein
MLSEFIGDFIWVAAAFLVPIVFVFFLMRSIVPDDLQGR